MSGVYGATLTYFYQVYLGLPAGWIALSAWIYLIWNALNDPLFGIASDKTKSSKGRRIPYMKFTAPFLAISFILVWLVPTAWSDVSIFWWMLITMLFYDSCYTIIGLVYSALLPEIVEKDDQRVQFQQFSSLFGLLGMVLGFLIPELTRPKAGQTSLVPFYVGMIIIGILGAGFVLITSMSFKEKRQFVEVDEALGFVDSIKYTFKRKSFLVLTSANFMSIYVQAALLGGMFYLADYVMQISTLILIVFVFLGLIIGVVLANLLPGKFGVLKAQQILLLTGGIPLILLPFLPNVAIYACLFFSGLGLSGPLVLTNVLFSQVTDEDETLSGVRREAAFFGINAMLTKPAQSIAIALGPLLIELVGFLVPATGEDIILDQPEAVIFMIKVVIGLLPGIALVIGALILIFYPLKGDYLSQIHQQVEKMHEEKKQKLYKMSKTVKGEESKLK